jgi:hypothetical protein
MAFDESPWGQFTGRRRVEAIRLWIKNDPNAGWVRPGGEPVIWNGADAESHRKTTIDPDKPAWPTPIATGQPQPTAAPKPKGEPKSLQIFWEDYANLRRLD